VNHPLPITRPLLLSCLRHWLPLLVWLATLSWTGAAHPEQGRTLHGTVVKVADGDTLTLQDAQHLSHRIRLAGIDAPERRQPYAQRARLHLAALVLGQTVSVSTHKQDRYGRAVGVVWAEDRDINLRMLQAGLAWHYTAFLREQSHMQRQQYAAAESQARAQGLGLWQQPDPLPPWTYRQQRRPH